MLLGEVMEKRGNSEAEIKMENGQLWMIVPGSDQKILYDGRYDHLQDGMIKKAHIAEGSSIFLEV